MKLSHSNAHFRTLSACSLTITPESAAFFQTRNLDALGSFLRSSESANIFLELKEPLAIENLDLLEAELNNQGIVPVPAVTLTQQATRDASYLRWKLRCRGVQQEFRFLVDIARYLNSWAEKIKIQLASFSESSLLSGLEFADSAELGDQQSALAQLYYLDSLAAYVIGRFSGQKHSLNHGLNLLLRHLAHKDLASTKGTKPPSLASQLSFPTAVLPLDRKHFELLVRQQRSAEKRPRSDCPLKPITPCKADVFPSGLRTQ